LRLGINVNKITLTNFLKSERAYFGIYLGAFLGACSISGAFTALPFVIKHFHGSDTAAGATISAFHILYPLFCILLAFFVDRLRPKITVILSLTSQIVICLLLWLTVRFNSSLQFDPIGIIILLCGLWGIALVFLWPPLMGWLSTGYEGPNLNRKLGIYNTSWSSGATIGPLICGYLASIDVKLPLALAAAMLALAAIMVNSSRKPQTFRSPAVNESGTGIIEPLLTKFRIAARVTLFTGFVCLGLSRAPLGLLMRYELPFTEAHFGAAVSIIAFTSTISFFVLGKFHAWHYKAIPVILAQTGLIAAMIIILLFDTLITIYFAAFIIGIATAFCYTSHMFYGVSATKRRSGAMAVHEIILSAGIGVGAYVGGYLSDIYGRKPAPYLFGLAVIGLGIAVQLFLNFRSSKRKGQSSA